MFLLVNISPYINVYFSNEKYTGESDKNKVKYNNILQSVSDFKYVMGFATIVYAKLQLT